MEIPKSKCNFKKQNDPETLYIWIRRWVNNCIQYIKNIFKRLHSWIVRIFIALSIPVIRFSIRKYPHLHVLNYFSLDKVTRNIFINEQNPLFENWFWSFGCWHSGGKFIRYIKESMDTIFSLNLRLDSSTLEEIEEIIAKRIEDNSDNEKDEKIVKLTDEIARMSKSIDTLTNIIQKKTNK